MEMKQRIIGFVVLLSLAVITLPLIFDSETVIQSKSPKPTAILPTPTLKVSDLAPKTSDQDARNQKTGNRTEKITLESLSVDNSETGENNANSVSRSEEAAVLASVASEPSSEEEIEAVPSKVSHRSNPQATQTTKSQEPSAPQKSVAVQSNSLGTPKSTAAAHVQTKNTPKPVVAKRVPEMPKEIPADERPADNLAEAVALEEKTLQQIAAEQQSAAESVSHMAQNTVSQSHTAQGSSGTSWVVQLGTFSNTTNARKLVSDLQSKGFGAFEEKDSARQHLHRVFVGPANDRASAEKIVASLENKVRMRGIIVRYQR